MYKQVLYTLLVFLVCACKPDYEDVRWDTQMLVPIARVKLNLEDLLKDSLIRQDENQLLELVFQEELTRVEPLDTLVKLNITPYQNQYSLTSITIEDIVFSEDQEIGELIIGAGLDGFVFPVVNIKLEDGADIPRYIVALLPEIDGQENVVDFSSYFTSGKLTSALLDVEINNNSPIAIESFDLVVRDIASGQGLFVYTVNSIIDKGQPYLDQDVDLTASLGGKTVGSQLGFTIENLKLTPSLVDLTDPFLLDYSDSFEMSFKIKDIKVEEATAVLPAQNVIELIDEVELDGSLDAELTFGTIKNGKVKVTVSNTLPVDLYFDYSIPSSKNTAGNSFEVLNQKVDAGSPATPTVFESVYDIANYDLDFSGVPSYLTTNPKYAAFNTGLTNTFIHELQGKILGSNTPIAMSLADYITVEVEIFDLEAEYVEGYIGQEVFSFGPETITATFDNELPITNADFEYAEVSLGFENYIGVPATATINTLSFKNTSTGQVIAANNLPGNIALPQAENVNTAILPGSAVYELNNATEVFNLKPDEITYSIDLNTNPNGNFPAYSNFAALTSELVLTSEIRIPLSIIANDFVLSDTILVGNDLAELRDMNDGKINLIVYNGFPFLADLQLQFIDSEGNLLDTIENEGQFPAGEMKEGRVVNATQSVISLFLDENRLSTIANETDRIAFKITINSQDKSKYNKVYSDYVFDIKLTGEFEVELNGGL